jgi:large subunit ribosomal protein L20
MIAPTVVGLASPRPIIGRVNPHQWSLIVARSIMPRVKRGVVRRAKRKKLSKITKGYFQNKSKLYKFMKESAEKAGVYAYVGRKRKKRDYRSLWIVRINAAAREHGVSYSVLMNGLKAAGVTLDRKSLAELAAREPAAFAALVTKAKAATQSA